MAIIATYRDLIAWQKSMSLAEAAYGLARKLPREEQYGLALQIRRAAVSIPANVAEGYNRHARRAYGNFVGIALGSLAELGTHLELAVRVGYVPRTHVEAAFDLIAEVGRVLWGLRGALEREGV